MIAAIVCLKCAYAAETAPPAAKVIQPKSWALNYDTHGEKWYENFLYTLDIYNNNNIKSGSWRFQLEVESCVNHKND